MPLCRVGYGLINLAATLAFLDSPHAFKAVDGQPLGTGQRTDLCAACMRERMARSVFASCALHSWMPYVVRRALRVACCTLCAWVYCVRVCACACIWAGACVIVCQRAGTQACVHMRLCVRA